MVAEPCRRIEAARGKIGKIAILAENTETEYVAYVSEQNLLPDTSGEPVRHPQVEELFVRCENGDYRMRGEWMAS